MYIDENDNRTPRERIDDSFLRRMLGEGEHTPEREMTPREGLPCNPQNGTAGNYKLVNFPLGMVYSPIQEWRNAYDTETALERGTLFRELDMPFYGDRKSAKGGNCRGY